LQISKAIRMPFAALLTLSCLGALSVWFVLAQGRARQLALPLTAALSGLTLAGLGLWMTLDSLTFLPSSAQQSAYHDTYYVRIHGQNILTLGLAYAVWAAITALIRHVGTGLTVAALPWAFALFHAAVTMQVLLVLMPPGGHPQRYIDVPATFALTQRLSLLSSGMAMVALLGLGLLLALALAQRVRKAWSGRE
jgi:hypothetical protein